MKTAFFGASIGVLVVCAITSAASAGPFTPAPGATYSMDLDTKDGNFSEWKLLDLNGANAARAKIAIRRLGQDPKWLPGFRFSVGDDKSVASFSIVALKGKIVATLGRFENGKDEADAQIYAFPPAADEVFDLELDWSADGKVTALIRTKAAQGVNGFERHEIAFGHPISWLRILGSTGELEVQKLQVGRAAP